MDAPWAASLVRCNCSGSTQSCGVRAALPLLQLMHYLTACSVASHHKLVLFCSDAMHCCCRSLSDAAEEPHRGRVAGSQGRQRIGLRNCLLARHHAAVDGADRAQAPRIYFRICFFFGEHGWGRNRRFSGKPRPSRQRQWKQQ